MGAPTFQVGCVTPIAPAAEPCAQARCEYCGRYAALGQCPGCGAPNRPIDMTAPTPGQKPVTVHR